MFYQLLTVFLQSLFFFFCFLCSFMNLFLVSLTLPTHTPTCIHICKHLKPVSCMIRCNNWYSVISYIQNFTLKSRTVSSFPLLQSTPFARRAGRFLAPMAEMPMMLDRRWHGSKQVGKEGLIIIMVRQSFLMLTNWNITLML